MITKLPVHIAFIQPRISKVKHYRFEVVNKNDKGHITKGAMTKVGYGEEYPTYNNLEAFTIEFKEKPFGFACFGDFEFPIKILNKVIRKINSDIWLEGQDIQDAHDIFYLEDSALIILLERFADLCHEDPSILEGRSLRVTLITLQHRINRDRQKHQVKHDDGKEHYIDFESVERLNALYTHKDSKDGLDANDGSGIGAVVRDASIEHGIPT
eukprot:UN32417